jgi:hypothetical protein
LLFPEALLKVSAKAEPQSRRREATSMKKVNVIEANDFSETGIRKSLIHDFPYFKILNSNFKAGQELPARPTTSRGR